MNVLIFLGPAGSGKGTQAQFLKDKLNYEHLSTGDLLRAEIKSNSDLGQQVQSVIHSGNLVSDDIILNIIKKNINGLKSSNKSGVIFDGFPRTIEQANSLGSLMNEMDLNLSKVLYFDLSLEESINRISGRLIDSRNNNVYHKISNPAPTEAEPYLISRKDDTPDKVTHRYNVYKNETAPLLDYYQSELFRIDCLQSIDAISNQITDLVDSFELSH
jgi:adenylate kinase